MALDSGVEDSACSGAGAAQAGDIDVPAGHPDGLRPGRDGAHERGPAQRDRERVPDDAR